jgi:hypothetical protein
VIFRIICMWPLFNNIPSVGKQDPIYGGVFKPKFCRKLCDRMHNVTFWLLLSVGGISCSLIRGNLFPGF